MILVDTSVWIDFFGGRPNASELGALLTNHNVVVHEFVYGELVMGNLGLQQKNILKNLSVKGLLKPHPISEIERFVLAHRLSGLGLSYIDIHLLYTCLAEEHTLWTHDKTLKQTANKFGVGF